MQVHELRFHCLPVHSHQHHRPHLLQHAQRPLTHPAADQLSRDHCRPAGPAVLQVQTCLSMYLADKAPPAVPKAAWVHATLHFC